MNKIKEAPATKPIGVPAPLPNIGSLPIVGGAELFPQQDLPPGTTLALESDNPGDEEIDKQLEQADHEAEEQRAAAQVAEMLTTSSIVFELPLVKAIPPKCHVPKRIDARLTRPQAIAFKRLHLALTAEGVMLTNGTHVRTPQDVVRWLLDQIAAEQTG